MFIHKVKYTDFNDVEREKTLYFNFMESEIYEMSLGDEDISARMVSIGRSKDNREIYNLMSSLVLDAYGEKDPTGESFIKSPEIRNAFKQSLAYDAFMDELLNDTELAVKFSNGIVPKKLSKRMNDPKYAAEIKAHMDKLGVDNVEEIIEINES